MTIAGGGAPPQEPEKPEGDEPATTETPSDDGQTQSE
jgi:hypothetical protein